MKRQPQQQRRSQPAEGQHTQDTGRDPNSVIPTSLFTSSAEEGPQPENVTRMKEQAVSEVLRGAAYQSDMYASFPTSLCCPSYHFSPCVVLAYQPTVVRQTSSCLSNVSCHHTFHHALAKNLASDKHGSNDVQLAVVLLHRLGSRPGIIKFLVSF